RIGLVGGCGEGVGSPIRFAGGLHLPRTVDVEAEVVHVLDRITSALDFQLYHLQRKYLDYQVKVGNKIIEELQQGNAGAAQLLSEKKRCFQDIVDDLFKATGKKIVRTENEIRFDQMGEILVPYQLSSGEKQILAILLTVLVENEESYVLFMDEPEVSLHVEWQERLVELILKLNPKVQIILTTHSPALIMNGWMDKVTEVTDITLHE
ncbi:MAG: ATP-binding protein, partial [Prevotella sp.]|nr:ATP-binding protein [Prevotella sp.]